MSSDRGTQTNKEHRVTLTPASQSTSKGVSESKESVVRNTRTPRGTLGLSSNESVYSCQFEVFGIVQGVSFRMYALRRAEKLGIRGWCQNTQTNTVKGEIEGHYNPFEEMRLWLKYTGSPTSRIDKVVFSETIERTNFTFENFSIMVD